MLLFWDCINISILLIVVGFIFIWYDKLLRRYSEASKKIDGLEIVEVEDIEYDALGRVKFYLVCENDPSKDYQTKFYRDNAGVCELDCIRIWYRGKGQGVIRAGIDTEPFISQDVYNYGRQLLIFVSIPCWLTAILLVVYAILLFYGVDITVVFEELRVYIYSVIKEVIKYNGEAI